MITEISQNKKIKMCALMLDPYDTCPGQRFRIEQWEPFLKQDGISIDYFSFTDENLRGVIYKQGHVASKIKELTKAYFRRIGHIINSSEYDVIFLYRTASMIGPAWLEKILSWQSAPIIFDFDDAIFLTNTSKANSRFGWTKFAGKTGKICRLSTTVTVGNSYLANYAQEYNNNVYVVPTSIDTDRYHPVKQKKKLNERLVIGWTGSSTSQYHLESFEPVLNELIKRRDVEIRVISDREPEFKQVPCVWKKWTSTMEVELTSGIDIGIMPLPDDEWTRGKCAAKALQYMALGIPTICSNVGANRDVIKHGENGFLAETTGDWLKYFEILIDDAEIRAELGSKARHTIVENYSMKKCAELFAGAVRTTISNKPKSDGK